MTPDPLPPTITVRCGHPHCRASESWLLPRATMIPLIADLARRKGWRLTTDRDLCPTHNPDVVPLAPKRRQRPGGPRLVWTRELIGRIAEMRDRRLTTREIARTIEDETGIRCTPGGVMMGYQRAWERLMGLRGRAPSKGDSDGDRS